MGTTYGGEPLILGVCKICGEHFDDYEGKPWRKYICQPCRNLEHKKRYRENCKNLDVYFKMILNTVKNDKYRGVLDNDLDVPYLVKLFELQEGCCALSNIPMTWGQSDPKDNKIIYRNPHNISIDRVDNTKGYTKDNVVLICFSLNVFKNSYDVSVVYNIVDQIAKHRNRLNEVMHLIHANIKN